MNAINDFDDIIREGWLYKQSKFLKEWRKYFILQEKKKEL